MQVTAINLAAGQGTRMRSSLAKVLHPLAGKPLICYSLEAVAGLSGNKPVLVVGHGSEDVREAIGTDARFAFQEEQLGTAHAVMAAESLAAGESDLVLVTNADMPLLSGQTLARLVQMQESNPGPFSMLTLSFLRMPGDLEGSYAARKGTSLPSLKKPTPPRSSARSRS